MRWPTAACMRRQHLKSSPESTDRGSLRVGWMECFHIVDSSCWHLPSTVPWEDSVRRWGCKHMTYDASYLAIGPTVARQPIYSNNKWTWGTALGPRVFSVLFHWHIPHLKSHSLQLFHSIILLMREWWVTEVQVLDNINKDSRGIH